MKAVTIIISLPILATVKFIIGIKYNDKVFSDPTIDILMEYLLHVIILSAQNFSFHSFAFLYTVIPMDCKLGPFSLVWLIW